MSGPGPGRVAGPRRLGAWLVVLVAAPVLAEGAIVRANCRGVQKLSTTEETVSCQESSVLSDGDDLVLGHTRARASLTRGRLSASAAGGQIRDAGANGGEAGALLKTRLTLRGKWEGRIPVLIRLCVAYRFAGFGESRVHATLRASGPRDPTGDNQARVRLRHRGFGGARLEDFGSRGRYRAPLSGSWPPESVFVLQITEHVDRDAPEIDVRADLAAFALPNLEPLEPVLSSFVRTSARIVIAAPPDVALASESGATLGEARAQEAEGAWVIMTPEADGGSHALRSDRGGHGAAARPDCGHQLGLDG